MKKIIFLLASVIGLSSAFGQSNKVVTAFNLMKPEYNELDKAKQAIDEASVHPKTSGEAKTWYYRGQVYYKIYQSKKPEFSNLDPNPLKQAYLSFVKAKELDVNKRFENELHFELTRTSADFFNKGSAEFEHKKFAESVESFETVIAIGKLPYIHQLDTGSFFNAALAADEAGLNEKAIEYYNKSIELNYGGPEVFHYLALIYLEKGDSASALKSYEAGIQKYPDTSANLYIAMINYYLGKKDVASAFGFVEKAIEKDSSNASLWQVYGRALEDRDTEKAIAAYKKMIQLDPKNFNGYYNVGTVYFNQGVVANDKANAIPLNDEAGYKAAVAIADNFFKEAMPYFEQAYEINKTDSDLLTGLKLLYYRFKMNDKLDEVQKRMDTLK
ncbi:MAG: tetratricopeptide repeat protein [Bacteroidales bacterium]|nr:tetratricopeptide repeat protein [Bacteroidales bacterium]